MAKFPRNGWLSFNIFFQPLTDESLNSLKDKLTSEAMINYALFSIAFAESGKAPFLVHYDHLMVKCKTMNDGMRGSSVSILCIKEKKVATMEIVAVYFLI